MATGVDGWVRPMRLFIAALLTEELIGHVAAAQQTLRSVAGEQGIRWARPEQYHYTLKFLGEQSSSRAMKAVEVALSVRELSTRFELALGGVGGFPNDQRPGVLWLGARAGVAPLADLAVRLDAALGQAGFRRDNRSFKPHLTLARIKTYKGEIGAARALKDFAASAELADVGRLDVDRFVLMQSIQGPAGSDYVVVEEFLFP